MILHTRRASLLIAFYLLTSAATAHAECAWVLWSQVVLRQTGQILAFPMRSFDTREVCERELFAAAKQREAENPESRIGFVCVPDTVDPRGPKGK